MHLARGPKEGEKMWEPKEGETADCSQCCLRRSGSAGRFPRSGKSRPCRGSEARRGGEEENVRLKSAEPGEEACHHHQRSSSPTIARHHLQSSFWPHGTRGAGEFRTHGGQRRHQLFVRHLLRMHTSMTRGTTRTSMAVAETCFRAPGKVTPR